ncbi:hypothetical protein FOZ62_021402, partial [Perkinsus olseni]
VVDGVDCPVDRAHELGAWRPDASRFITDLVETSDFVVRRLGAATDSLLPAFWEVEWKWRSTPPARHLMPPDYGTAKYGDRLQAMWRAAVEEWIAEGWLVPSSLSDLHATSPLMLVPQEHKLSTP